MTKLQHTAGWLAIILLLLLVSSYSPADKHCVYFKKACDLIKNDTQVQNFLNVHKNTKLKLIIAREQIQFNLKALTESIVAKNYLKGYSYFPGRELTDNERKTERMVSDSLYTQDILLNKGFVSIDNISCASGFDDLNTAKGIIFFSKIYKNQLYAELIPLGDNDKRTDSAHYVSFAYGKSLTWLFVFQDGKIIAKYKGEVYNN